MTNLVPAQTSSLRRDMIIVAVAALAMRLAFGLLYRSSPFFHVPVVDAATFHQWAMTLQSGQSFMPGVFFKPPLYPYVLSWWYGVAGTSPAMAYGLQALMGMGTAILTLLLGRHFLAPRTALAGALALALLPVPVFLEFQLLAEPLTTLLLMTALVVLAPWVKGQDRRDRRLIWAGLALGIAALGRPNLLILPPVLAVWFWWRLEPRRWQGPAFLLIATFLAISPAVIHNLGQGAPVLVSANLGPNLWAGIRPEADGASAIPIGIQWDDLQVQCEEAGAASIAESSRYLTRRSLGTAVADPLRSLGLLGRKALLLINAVEGRNNIGAGYLAREQGLFLLHRWWPGFWLLAPFSLLGLTALLWPRLLGTTESRPGTMLILVYLGALALAVLPFFVNARFRAPLLPGMALLAAHGIWAMIGARGSMRWRSLALVLVFGVLVNIDWFGIQARETGARDEMHLADIMVRGHADQAANPSAAVAHFEKARKLAPLDPDVHEHYGLTIQMLSGPLLSNAARARQQGQDSSRQEDMARLQYQRALNLHQEAIRLFPRSYGSHGSVAYCRLVLGQIDNEQSRVALARGDSLQARTLGVSAARSLVASLESWQRATRIKPNLPGARQTVVATLQLLQQIPDLDPEITDIKERLPR